MTICPYCLVEHGRPSPAVYCSEEHARASARAEARAAGRGRRTLRKVVQAEAQEQLGAKRWRDIAMGRNEEQRLGEIFKPGKKKRA